MSEPLFTFEVWRGYLAFDAEQAGIRHKVELMQATMLESVWRAGVEPTIRGVIQYCEAPGPNLCTECQNLACNGSTFCATHFRLHREELIRKADSRIREARRQLWKRRSRSKRPAGVSDSVTIALARAS